MATDSSWCCRAAAATAPRYQSCAPAHTRYPHEDRRALSGRGFERELSSDQSRALAHADQPQASILRRIAQVRRKALAVVFDDQHGDRVANGEQHADARRARVLLDVVQRFLDDAIEVDRDVVRERRPVRAFAADYD